MIVSMSFSSLYGATDTRIRRLGQAPERLAAIKFPSLDAMFTQASWSKAVALNVS